MVSVDRILIFMLSVSVKTLEIPCAEAAEALAHRAWDLRPDDLLSPLHTLTECLQLLANC